MFCPTQGDLDRERFGADLRRTLERDTAYMADLRVFVSKGQSCSCSDGLPPLSVDPHPHPLSPVT